VSPVPYMNVSKADLEDPLAANLNTITRTHTDELNRLAGLNGTVQIVSGINASSTVSAPSLEIAGGLKILSGGGTPNGSITAPPGSIYLNVNGGSGGTMWVKTSGTGNTGWTAIA
jgi:hypothetical protein